jgi:hypothetical protein
MSTVWVPNTLTFLQTILAAEVHLADGQFLRSEQELEGQQIPKGKDRI